MAPQRVKGRQAVYLIVTSDDFRPQRPWDFPMAFSGGTLYAKNLTMVFAHGFARTHNKRAIQQRECGTWDHKWAIVVKHVKAQQHGEHPDARANRKGDTV